MTRTKLAGLLSLIFVVGCLGGMTESTQEPGPQDCKILFIGNSLTYFNDQPAMVEQMATSAGLSVYIDEVMMGGATLEDHLYNGTALQKIEEREWDVVILQQAIMAVAFPDMHAGISGPIETLRDAVLGKNADAEVVYFLDYSMKNGLYWLGEFYTYEASQQMLYDGTLVLADSLDLSVAPVGWAWNTVIRDRSDLDLFDIDNVHPSYLGSYLGAAVYFATIFRQSAAGNPHGGTLSSDVAQYLRTAASETVLDSLDVWRLSEAGNSCRAH